MKKIAIVLAVLLIVLVGGAWAAVRVLLAPERVRAAVEAQLFKTDTAELRATCSVGVAEYDGAADDPLALVEAADSALYAAKTAGRNRVLLKYNTP